MLQIPRSTNDCDVVFEENTYKHYYYPPSDDEDLTPYQQTGHKRTNNESIDEFFAESSRKKAKAKRSSTVGRPNKDSISYVSTNTDDGATATHMIKIDVYELKKLENVDQADHWKHADIRVKYFTKSCNDNIHKKTRQIIYEVTKTISNSPECRKYTIINKP